MSSGSSLTENIVLNSEELTSANHRLARGEQPALFKPIQRTSSSSFKISGAAKKHYNNTAIQLEPKEENPTSVFEYISNPVKYIASVFSPPEPDQIAKRPLLRSRSASFSLSTAATRVLEKQLLPKSEGPASVSASPLVLISPAAEPVATNMDAPAAIMIPCETEQSAPVTDKVVELLQNTQPKEKKPPQRIADSKKTEIKRSRSVVSKGSTQSSYSIKSPGHATTKGQSHSSSTKMQSENPRMLQSSSVRMSAINQTSYRITSVEKEESAKTKKPNKRVFKIDKDREKSPSHASRLHHQMSAPIGADKRDDSSFQNYVPLTSIEISRM